VAQVLRMVSGFLDRLPASSSEELSKELTNECTETTVVNMLCLITRGVSECHQLVDVSAVAYSRK
jgi:hypothetical protein